jgi:hypothetical protein
VPFGANSSLLQEFVDLGLQLTLILGLAFPYDQDAVSKMPKRPKIFLVALLVSQ